MMLSTVGARKPGSFATEFFAPRAFVLAAALLLAIGPVARAQSDAIPKTNFFLPKNPVVAAYVLGRLSNKELIEAPRSEFVYVALLQRNGLDKKFRIEALEGLAKIRGTDRWTELLRALGELDPKGENSEPVVQELSALLLQAKADDLSPKRDAAKKLATEAKLAVTRQSAGAALLTGDGSLDRAWSEFETTPAHLADLIAALPLVRDPKLRASAYARVEPLVRASEPAEIRRAAILALSGIPGHETETFRTLATLAREGVERAAAVSSLQRIPKKFWVRETAEPLVRRLIEAMQQTSADERTSPDFLATLQLATELATLLPKETAVEFNKTLRGLGPVVVVIHTIYEQMLYDKQLIVVEPGKTVEITLENADAMPHNLVIVEPGAVEEIGTAAEKMPPDPDPQGRLYIPDTPRVLHATKMVDPGQKAKLSFTAPETPGEYPYLCTFPGHWRRMTGILAVTPDVDAYLANRSANEAKVTEWTIADFAADLAGAVSHGNTAAGQELFTKLSCAQCHKLGKEGANYGPDLTDVFKKWKGDRSSLLRQILEPSLVIEDRYKVYELELKDGDSIFGIVVREDDNGITVQTGPTESLIQTLKKSDIKQRKPQASSVMPVGLLNTLTKEQIFDLLAFIEAGGEVRAHEHKH